MSSAVRWAALLAATMAMATASAQAQQDGGLAALNAVRQAAGLNSLAANPQLARAARDHVNYLARNNVSSHDQERGRPGFTGESPGARARAAGYPILAVSENLAKGADTVQDAVDDLISAIYHRFGFLAFDIDEVGIAVLPGGPAESRYVFKMGNRQLTGLCINPPAAARFEPPGTYVDLCGDQGTRLKLDFVGAKMAAMRGANPPWVLWPPPRSIKTPPAFFEEEPDPLPDLEVSGYPVSIQFNPGRVQQVKLTSFRLFTLAGAPGTPAGATRQEVRETRLLRRETDPHKRFSDLEFALFPLRRMPYGQWYQAVAEAEVDGQPQRLAWEFRTLEAGYPLLVVGERPVWPVQSGVDYAIYSPPTPRLPRIGKYAWEHDTRVKVAMQPMDPNTVRARVTGEPCRQALLRLEDGRTLMLQVARPGATTPEQALAGCGAEGAEFAIAGRGERLILEPGRPYRIHLQATAGGPHIDSIRWRFPQGAHVQADAESGEIVKIEIRGKPCDIVHFEISGGREFDAVVAGPHCPATHPKSAR